MSYVKAGVIHEEEFHIVEVHGSQLKLDVTRQVVCDEDFNTSIVEIPKLESGEEYRKWCQENGVVVSGIKEKRFEKGIPTIETDADKEKFLGELLKHDIRDWADPNRNGYRYNSVIDLDNEVFISMFENWYAHYQNYLPDGWRYIEVPADVMNILRYEHSRESEDYQWLIESDGGHEVEEPVILSTKRAKGLVQVPDLPKYGEEPPKSEMSYYFACPEHGKRIPFTTFYARKDLAEDDLERYRNSWCFD